MARSTCRSVTPQRLPPLGWTARLVPLGDSYDNALAETVIGLYKTELVRRHGPWRTLEHLELSTLEWVDWYNTRRLHSWCGNVPPAEYEAAWAAQATTATP